MRVAVDFDSCDENAVCMGIAPEVFDVDEGGLHLLQEYPAEQLREKVLEAERQCPTRAITIEG